MTVLEVEAATVSNLMQAFSPRLQLEDDHFAQSVFRFQVRSSSPVRCVDQDSRHYRRRGSRAPEDEVFSRLSELCCRIWTATDSTKPLTKSKSQHKSEMISTMALVRVHRWFFLSIDYIQTERNTMITVFSREADRQQAEKCLGLFVVSPMFAAMASR